MEQLTLGRYEAQGNDFLIALLTERELLDLDASLATRDLARPDVARVVCDRHLGVGTRQGYVHARGADGYIVGVHDAVNGRPADCIRMHLLNADGSFAETSGNGLACLALASHDAGILNAGVLQIFETDAGKQRCTVAHRKPASGSAPVQRADADGCFVDVAMPPVIEGPEIPAELEDRIRSTFGGNLRHVGTGSVGNPHLVIALASPPLNVPVDELSEHAAELGGCVTRLGRIYEAYFPDGINVEFIWPFRPNPLQRDQAWTLQMSVWERGAGLTVSCGTGYVAAATLARRWGFVRDVNEVDIRPAPVDASTDGHSAASLPRVRTNPPPQLGTIARCIETDISFELDSIEA